MCNGIRPRQNEEHSIEMLAAQRQLHNDVKKYNCLYALLCVWIPFVLSIACQFHPWECFEKDIELLSLGLGFLAVSVVAEKIKNLKELAASIQQQFDIFVYTMPWDERIFGENINLNHEIASYSRKILLNAQEKRALYDWYTPPVDEKDLYEGILFCQRENVWWDICLRKRFKLANIRITVALCIVVFIMWISKYGLAFNLIYSITFILPMIKWSYDIIREINTNINTLIKIEDSINGNDMKSMEDLQDIQKLIFDHRKNCFSIPNIFLKLQ